MALPAKAPPLPDHLPQWMMNMLRPRVQHVPQHDGADSFLERLRVNAPPVTGILWPTRMAVAAAAMVGNPIPTAHVTGDPEPLRAFR